MTTVMQLVTDPARYSMGVGPRSRPPSASGSSATNVQSRPPTSVCWDPVPRPEARSVVACAGEGGSWKRRFGERPEVAAVEADEPAETAEAVESADASAVTEASADGAAEALAGESAEEVTCGAAVDMGPRLGGAVTPPVNPCHIRSRNDTDHTPGTASAPPAAAPSFVLRGVRHQAVGHRDVRHGHAAALRLPRDRRGALRGRSRARCVHARARPRGGPPLQEGPGPDAARARDERVEKR